MGKINWGRVLLGGAVAGIVIFVFESFFEIVFAKEWRAAMENLGRAMQEPAGNLVLAVGLTVGVGVSAVWLYAAVRPRFGPGPKTAALVGLAYWVVAYLIPSIAWGTLVHFPSRMLEITILWTLPEILVATTLGAWLYRE